MTAQEFRQIAAFIDQLWKDEFDELKEAAYGEVLAPFPVDQVRQAVVNLGRRPGGAWSPSVTELVAEVRAIAYIGTAEWARERLMAATSWSALADVDGDWPFASANGRLRCDHVAELVVAIHPDHGPRLVRALGRTPLRLARDARWWTDEGEQRWTAAAFEAIEAASAAGQEREPVPSTGTEKPRGS